MKIQLKRSNVLDGGEAKAPSADQLEYGELAVNYAASDPTIFLKNSNNVVIPIATGSANWTQDGNNLYPSKTTNTSVFIGGTTAGTADIVLSADGFIQVGSDTKTTGYGLLAYSSSDRSDEAAVWARNNTAGGLNYLGYNNDGSAVTFSVKEDGTTLVAGQFTSSTSVRVKSSGDATSKALKVQDTSTGSTVTTAYVQLNGLAFFTTYDLASLDALPA